MANCTADSTSSTMVDSGIGSPSLFMVSLNSSLSSACSMAFREVPKSSTLYFSKIPCSESCTARFRPAWPPNVAKSPSGFSLLIICSINSTVNGSIYTRSAMCLSVIMVAGLLFTNTTSKPSSLRARQAWEPA